MENQGQMNNNGKDDISPNTENELVYMRWESFEGYDMDSLLGGDEGHLNSDQATVGMEQRPKESTSSSRRIKRFSTAQLQLLESSFQESTHPDDETRQTLAAKLGIEAKQVKFWFQNRRSQTKVKSYEVENNTYRKQYAELLAENKKLQEQLRELSCSRCGDPVSERWHLINENARLKESIRCANATGAKLMQEPKLPPSMTPQHLPSSSVNPNPMNPLANNGSSSTSQQVALLHYAECAYNEFQVLARNGPPLWLPTNGGEILNDQQYTQQRFPGLLGLCPQGFVVEATRDTALVRGSSSELSFILSDVPRWSDMFPGIVARVRFDNIVPIGRFGSSDYGIVQELNVDLWHQSPCLPFRSMKILRISKQTASREWAVVDVSIDGTLGGGQEGSQNRHRSCRLLPSGCLLQDKGNGYCQVTWIVHAQYEEATVPALFRQFFQSGEAYGASRWLAALQRYCEYTALLSSVQQVPSGDSSGAVAIPMPGRSSLLDLAQRMMASFYRTISGPPNLEYGSIVTQWRASSGTAAAEMLEPTVRIVLGNYSGTDPSSLLELSASTTVWLPGTAPEYVFEYLSNGQRRGEWDSLVYAGAVQELSSVATCPPHRGNAVSVLSPTETAAINNHMLLLQQTSIDVSGSMVVYSLIEMNAIGAVLAGGDSSTAFVLPSGFAILPDGHGKSDNGGASSSNGPAGHNSAAGSLLSVACQALVPSSFSNDPTDAARTIDDVGKQICQAIKNIMAAVGADIALPA